MNPTRLLTPVARSLSALGLTLAPALLALPSARAQSTYATPYTFTTIAGSPFFFSEVDATGAAARLLYPDGVAVDGSGNVYVADVVGTIRRSRRPAP